MNAKTILNKFLSTTLAVALLFSLSPLAATATEPETADAATATDASTAPAVSADTTDETVAETPAEFPEPQYSEDDYTYMYLVTEKTYIGKAFGKSYHDRYKYKYDDYGLVIESNRSNDGAVEEGELGETIYKYENENLISVDGPYFFFEYAYDKKGRIKKYDMSSAMAVMSYKGPLSYKHNLKYRKKDRSIYNPRCGSLWLLSRGDRYFFNKKYDRPIKIYKYHKKSGNYPVKEYYKYDKRGNISQIRKDDKTVPTYPRTIIDEYKNSYKNGRLIKRATKDPLSPGRNVTTKFKYKKVKMLKKYAKAVKGQQWRILNFDDREEFGINQPWKY